MELQLLAQTAVDSGAAAVPDIKQHRRLLHVPVRMQSPRPFCENMSSLEQGRLEWTLFIFYLYASQALHFTLQGISKVEDLGCFGNCGGSSQGNSSSTGAT